MEMLTPFPTRFGVPPSIYKLSMQECCRRIAWWSGGKESRWASMMRIHNIWISPTAWHIIDELHENQGSLDHKPEIYSSVFLDMRSWRENLGSANVPIFVLAYSAVSVSARYSSSGIPHSPPRPLVLATDRRFQETTLFHVFVGFVHGVVRPLCR